MNIITMAHAVEQPMPLPFHWLHPGQVRREDRHFSLGTLSLPKLKNDIAHVRGNCWLLRFDVTLWLLLTQIGDMNILRALGCVTYAIPPLIRDLRELLVQKQGPFQKLKHQDWERWCLYFYKLVATIWLWFLNFNSIIAPDALMHPITSPFTKHTRKEGVASLPGRLKATEKRQESKREREKKDRERERKDRKYSGTKSFPKN